jgi:hypothetical protein
MTRHSAPGGQVNAGAGIAGNDLERSPGFQLVHSTPEFENELPAAHFAGVPMLVQELTP